MKEEANILDNDLMSVVKLSEKESDIIGLFTNATTIDWEDWKWQMRKRICTKNEIAQIVKLSPEEENGIDKAGKKLTMSVTPYFASLIDPKDPSCPIRKQCIPTDKELETFDEEMADPCAEDIHSPVHGLVHRYPDRVLFLVSEMCAMYCRFCTRSRMVGEGKRTLSKDTFNAAFDYIRNHPEIRDVLISGGDPLLLSDRILENIIKTLKSIPHVEFIRIGTRTPVTLPQRITNDLVAMLKKYSPIWFSLHFNHPKEITKRVKFACELLADSGFPLGSQTVLLKGINDNPKVMKKLMHELLKIRVKPYYIYQCDPILGSRHFRTKVETGIDIIKSLRGHTSGYAVPTYVIDCPGGGGKTPINPDYIVSNKKGCYTIRNFAGKEFKYYDPKA